MAKAKTPTAGTTTTKGGFTVPATAAAAVAARSPQTTGPTTTPAPAPAPAPTIAATTTKTTTTRTTTRRKPLPRKAAKPAVAATTPATPAPPAPTAPTPGFFQQNWKTIVEWTVVILLLLGLVWGGMTLYKKFFKRTTEPVSIGSGNGSTNPAANTGSGASGIGLQTTTNLVGVGYEVITDHIKLSLSRTNAFLTNEIRTYLPGTNVGGNGSPIIINNNFSPVMQQGGQNWNGGMANPCLTNPPTVPCPSNQTATLRKSSLPAFLAQVDKDYDALDLDHKLADCIRVGANEVVRLRMPLRTPNHDHKVVLTNIRNDRAREVKLFFELENGTVYDRDQFLRFKNRSELDLKNVYFVSHENSASAQFSLSWEVGHQPDTSLVSL